MACAAAGTGGVAMIDERRVKKRRIVLGLSGFPCIGDAGIVLGDVTAVTGTDVRAMNLILRTVHLVLESVSSGAPASSIVRGLTGMGCPPDRGIRVSLDAEGYSIAVSFPEVFVGCEASGEVPGTALFDVCGQERPTGVPSDAPVFAFLEGLAHGVVAVMMYPESGLHPERINALAETLAHMISEKGNRVVLSTHSPQLLMALEGVTRDVGLSMTVLDMSDGRVDDVSGNPEPVYNRMAVAILRANSMYEGDDRDCRHPLREG